MEVVYKSRPGAIRSMSVRSDAEHQLTRERQFRAQAEAELQASRDTITAFRTRLAHAELALDECKAELAAERARVAVPEPVVEAPTISEPTAPKRPVGRPRKTVAENTEAEPQPVRWWVKGSKWDRESD